MKKLRKENLLNAVVAPCKSTEELRRSAYNFYAEPYCVEDEKVAEELYNSLLDGYEEITDISDAIEAFEKLKIEPDMQVRRIFEYPGGIFALKEDIVWNKDYIEFTEVQWHALMNFEPGLFIKYEDLDVVANIANNWFANYKIKESKIMSLDDLGYAIVAGKVEPEDYPNICEERGWLCCSDYEYYDDTDIAVDLFIERGERLTFVDTDAFIVAENRRSLKYKDYWVSICEDSQYYYIDFQTGTGEAMYPKSSFTLEQALSDQYHLDEEQVYSDDDRERAEEEIARKVLARYNCEGADLYLYYDGDGGFSKIEIPANRANLQMFADYFCQHEEEFASNIKVSDFDLDDEDDREEFADIVRDSIREYATEVAGDYDYMWGTIEED